MHQISTTALAICNSILQQAQDSLDCKLSQRVGREVRGLGVSELKLNERAGGIAEKMHVKLYHFLNGPLLTHGWFPFVRDASKVSGKTPVPWAIEVFQNTSQVQSVIRLILRHNCLLSSACKLELDLAVQTQESLDYS